VVMSARPGRISEVIEIDLPQPRDEATRETDRYYELVTQVREALRGSHGGPPVGVASKDRARAEGGIG
jgi:NitT/TauT family transport system ATP-binding protein